jgi:hypothetical protein
MNAEEKFKKDLLWIINELKQEEMANTYSGYQLKFRIERNSDNEPDIRSQHRIIKMLSDRKAISTSPFFHGMGMLNSVFEMQGATPIGYYVQFHQPKFNKVYEEITAQKVTTPTVKTTEELPPPTQADNQSKYFVTLTSSRQVVLNNAFILSSPNFDTENHKFIEYITEHPDTKFQRTEIETDLKVKLKKSFHAILSDLGFKGEIKKIFFEASKVSVKFKNNVPESELQNLGVDQEKLKLELSGLERIDKKNTDTKGTSMK